MAKAKKKAAKKTAGKSKRGTKKSALKKRAKRNGRPNHLPGGAGFTVRSKVSAPVPAVAMIDAVPAETPSTVPSFCTVAIAGAVEE